MVITILEISFIVLIMWSMVSLVNDRKHPEKYKQNNAKWDIIISIGEKKYLLHNKILKYGLFIAIYCPPLENKSFIILEGIFIVLIIMKRISLVFGKGNSEIIKSSNKNISINSKDMKLIILIMVCINFVCHVIDYLFNTDMISAITYHKGGGMTISFIGVFILLITYLLIISMIYLEKKKNQ